MSQKKAPASVEAGAGQEERPVSPYAMNRATALKVYRAFHQRGLRVRMHFDWGSWWVIQYHANGDVNHVYERDI